MPNRQLAAKAKRAASEKILAAQAEYSKPYYNQRKADFALPLASVADITWCNGREVRRVGMVRTDRQMRAVVNGVEVVAWKRGEKALTMRQSLRQHF